MVDEEENLANEISKFIHKSYQQLPSRLGPAAYFRRLSYRANHPVDGIKCTVFPVVTGSTAEFYIDPMLKCVRDVDMMYHYSNELAIPVGHRPPCQLPTEFDSCVKVFELVDSQVPGYVYLHMKYILSKRKTDGKCIIAEYVNRPNVVLSHEFYVTAGVRERAEVHGPSACMAGEDDVDFMRILPADTVPCVRCLVWPTQADNWPTRHRKYNWPDSKTVSRVVGNGCDVVGVAHTLCAQDEWMSKHQWRLSFSRAEVVLLNNWVPIQQIIYHMIRIFMKTERLTGLKSAVNTDKSMFSNYHIKTMMLWACELVPLHRWTDNTNLVNLFAQCLYFLKEWITKRCGRHYFIKNVHFLDYIDSLSMNTVIAVVNSTTEDCLAKWFVDNYIRKCVELCPDNLSILYSDVATKEMVHDTATAIVRWKGHIFATAWSQRYLSIMRGFDLASFRSWEIPVIDRIFSFAKPHLFSAVIGKQDQLDSFLNAILNTVDIEVTSPLKNAFIDWIVPLSKKEGQRLHNNINLHAFLNAFLNLSDTEEEFPFKKVLDFVAFLSDDHIRRFDTIASSNGANGLLSLSKAMAWMKIVADKQNKSRKFFGVNIAKVYLVRAMRCTDSVSDSICGVANVYMAVLCYITGEYQKAADHCALVTRSQGCSQCSSRVVDGVLLPKIDDDIDTVLGLAVFYHYLQTTALKRVQHMQHASVFSMELFAHYFSIRHLLVRVVNCHLAREKHALRKVKFHLCEQVKLFFHRILSAPRLFVTDLILLKFSNNSSSHQ